MTILDLMSEPKIVWCVFEHNSVEEYWSLVAVYQAKEQAEEHKAHNPDKYDVRAWKVNNKLRSDSTED